ncbi:hypothetical protein [Klebsiella pneumoniae]|nr:hypothetical protein [Klebsiella pneumoniae]
MNECSNKPERLFKPVPDSLMSEYLAMIEALLNKSDFG